MNPLPNTMSSNLSTQLSGFRKKPLEILFQLCFQNVIFDVQCGAFFAFLKIACAEFFFFEPTRDENRSHGFIRPVQHNFFAF